MTDRKPIDLTDWAAFDAMTDEDIARQIAENPDAAPECDEEWFAGATIVHPAGGDPPEAAFFACKDGSVRRLMMDSAAPPCDDCDCGYAGLLTPPLATKDR